jgi:hypothetical protein
LAVTAPKEAEHVSFTASKMPENNRRPVPLTVRSIVPTDVKMPELMGRMNTVTTPEPGVDVQPMDI